MGTTNFDLTKVSDQDMAFSDYLGKLQEITNDNLDIIDSALANFNVETISADYYIQPTDQFVNVMSGTVIIRLPAAASVSTGKVIYIGNDSGNTARIQGVSGTVNGAANVSLTGAYAMKVVVKSPTEWVAY